MCAVSMSSPPQSKTSTTSKASPRSLDRLTSWKGCLQPLKIIMEEEEQVETEKLSTLILNFELEEVLVDIVVTNQEQAVQVLIKY